LKENTLKQKAFSGILWTFVEQAFLTLFRTLINLFIARQLFPADYGLIAVITVFIHVSEVIVNGGMKNALIRKPELKPEDLSTVFLFNLGVALLIYVAFYLSAPAISSFYDIPGFTTVARVLGIVIIIHAFSLVQDALINRTMKLKYFAKINITATFIGGVAGLVAAYNGLGVWSLVIQSLTKATLISLIFWVNTSWYPSLKLFSIVSFTENFLFGYKLILAGLVSAVFNNLYQLVIGKVYSASNLGNYSQGKRLGELPSQTFYVLFQRTGFPLLSSIQDDVERFKKLYLKLFRMLAFFSFPFAFLMLLIGEPLIILLLTEKWANAIPFFYILCFSGMFFPFSGISAHACLAKGRSDLFLKYEIIYKVLMVIMIFVTYRYDILIMVSGQAFLLMVQFVVNMIVAGKVIDLRFLKQISSIVPHFSLSILSFVSAYLITRFDMPVVLKISFQIFTFLVVYLVSSYFFKPGELKAVREIIHQKLFRF
jgi:teichuronic acid exporter